MYTYEYYGGRGGTQLADRNYGCYAHVVFGQIG
jgi:hypothetical protein